MTQEKLEKIYDIFCDWYKDDGSYDEHFMGKLKDAFDEHAEEIAVEFMEDYFDSTGSDHPDIGSYAPVDDRSVGELYGLFIEAKTRKIQNMSNERITTTQILKLIRSLPDASFHIYQEDKGSWNVTNEWLCGAFAGRGFEGETLDEAANKLIDHLYEHIGHDSMVGTLVTKSGFPDLDQVKKYCEYLNRPQDLKEEQ